ncbi:hypothetical protein AOQ84DRAFT_352669, partial [Glonium stellatum]
MAGREGGSWPVSSAVVMLWCGVWRRVRVVGGVGAGVWVWVWVWGEVDVGVDGAGDYRLSCVVEDGGVGGVGADKPVLVDHDGVVGVEGVAVEDEGI